MNPILARQTASWALWRLAAGALIVAASAVVASAYCSPDQCDVCNMQNCNLSCCYDAPELWVVNTRALPKCGNLDHGFENLSIKRWDPKCRRFVCETYESFLAQEATMPTLIFAHGNTLKHKGAMKQCWNIYQKMRCCPGQKRLVFWSWPAQIAIKRPIIRPKKVIMANLRIKFVYSEYQGYYMAKFVQGMSMSQRVTVGGHSYGGIIAPAAAHFLGGGTLRGLSLAGAQPVERPNFRVAIISGAFDNDSLYENGRYGQCFVAAEKLWLTRNAIDKTLKKWPKVSLRGRMALGVTGLNTDLLGEYASKLCQLTMTADVGKSHYIDPHLKSGRFVSMLCCFAFPECAACAAAQLQAAQHGESSEAPAGDAPASEVESGPEISIEAAAAPKKLDAATLRQELSAEPPREFFSEAA